MFKFRTILMAVILMAVMFITVTASADTEVTLTNAQLEQILNSGNVATADSMTITIRVIDRDAVPSTYTFFMEAAIIALIIMAFGNVVAICIILIMKLFSRLFGK
ncbi:MAG: hypothetical protein WCW66_02590 [Patescibacteria group bacterium]